MTRESFKERARKQREQEILLATGRLMRECGYDKLNMDRVAEAVGIAKPTLYQHFNSKDELIARVMANAMEAMEQHLLNLPPASPRAHLEHLYEMLLTERFSPDGILANLDSVQILTLMRTNPAVRSAKERIGSYLRRLIEEGKTQGEISREMPTQFIMHYLFHTLGIVDVMYPDKTAPEWQEFLNGHFAFMLNAFRRVIDP